MREKKSTISWVHALAILSTSSEAKAIDMSFQEIKYLPESAGNVKSLAALK